MQAVVHTTTRHTIVKVTPYCPRHSCFGHAYISNVSAQWRTRTHQDIVQTASPWFDIGQARWYHRCTFDIKRLLSEHDSAAVSRCLARLPPPQRVCNVMDWRPERSDQLTVAMATQTALNHYTQAKETAHVLKVFEAINSISWFWYWNCGLREHCTLIISRWFNQMNLYAAEWLYFKPFHSLTLIFVLAIKRLLNSIASCMSIARLQYSLFHIHCKVVEI